MTRIRVVLAGATGKTGSWIARGLKNAGDLHLVGAVARRAAGQDLGDALGAGSWGVPIYRSAGDALSHGDPDVLVDFTHGEIGGEHALKALRSGTAVVMGTTGISAADLEAIGELCQETSLGAILIANFSVGAHLLSALARQASRIYRRGEIIEMHHDAKLDSPSGTAIRLGEILTSAGVHDAAIHSVRLPGLVAHHKVLFGGEGETLTISHDTTGRWAFVPGVLLAVRKVMSLGHLVTDMGEIFPPTGT